MSSKVVFACTLGSTVLVMLLPSIAPACPDGCIVVASVERGAPENLIAQDTKMGAGPSSAQSASKTPKPSHAAKDWRVAVYPILVWAPVMSGSFSAPPSATTLPVYPEADVAGGLTGAALFGIALQKKWWVADLSVLWASLDGRRTQPPAYLDINFLLYDASVGVKVHRDLHLTAGVRRMEMNLDATEGNYPTVAWKPRVTDPLLGLEYRRSLGKQWEIDLALKGGGFGIGSDVDLSATGRLDWRFARHFGLAMGYGGLHFKITSQFMDASGTVTRRTTQTLHGLIFGFGIYF